MPIWDGAVAVLLERSSNGNTATVLGGGDAVLATCNDAGTVVGADGSMLLTAVLSMPTGTHYDAPGADIKRMRARVEVAAADGTAAGTLGVKRFTVTPFAKKLTIAMLDPSGAELGELFRGDRKGRELVVTSGGSSVAKLALADRDRSLRRTIERWSLEAESRPPTPADLLVTAAILRYNKLLAEVAVPAGG